MRHSNSSISRFLTGTAVALVLASPALADSQEQIDDITLPKMSANVERTPEGQQEAATPVGDNLGNHIATEKIQATNGMDITGGYSLVVTGGGSLYVTDGGDLNLTNGSVTGLADPTMSNDAATKRYVDQAVNGLGGGDDLGNHIAKQDLDMGGKRVGNLATPVASTQAATKGYVDTAVAGAGDDMGDHVATQNIDASNFEVINLGAPTTLSSAVTKEYVDNAVGAGSATGVNNTRKINTGTGLVGGGDLSADRTLSFDTGWGDGRYVQRSQTIGAGDGLTGGGALSGTPSFAVDGTVVRTSGAQTIGGNKTFTGDVNLSNRRLLGLANPTGGSDAANKSYVDTAISAVSGIDNTVVRTFGDQSIGGVKTFTDDVFGDGFKATTTGFYGHKWDSAIAPTLSWIDDVHTGIYNPASGQISFSSNQNEVFRMTGTGATSLLPLAMNNQRITGLATPTAAGDAATKAYVDSKAGGGTADNLGNHTATTTLNLSSNRITNLANPVGAGDAVNKTYVDTAIAGVSGGALDDTVVRTFGDQTIDGVKTFKEHVFADGFKARVTGFYGHGGDSAISPTLSWMDDVHTGIYNPASGQISFASNRTEMFRLSGTGHTSMQPIAMSGKAITGLAAPVNANDAATKAYVDSKAGGGAADNLGNHTATTTLNLANNRITGLATPTANTDATTKAYVDAAVGAAKGGNKGDDLGNHTALQALNMNAYQVTGLAAPTSADHAVNRGYLDGRSINAGDGLTGGGAMSADRTIAVDGTVVRTSGNQTIGGTKVFSNIIYGDGGEVSARSAGNRLFRMRDENNQTEALLYHNASDNTLRARLYDAAGSGAVKSEMVFFQSGVANYNNTFQAPTFNATSTSGGGFQGIAADSAGAPSYTWTGDLNTGIFTPGADILAVTTGGNERLNISSTGIDVKNLRVLNVANPTGAGDAVNKSYVDTAIAGVAASGVDSTVVRTFGDQTVGGTKTFNGALITKGASLYVDGGSNRHIWFRDTAGKNLGIVYQEQSTGEMKIRAYDNGTGTGTKSEMRLLQDGRAIFSGTTQAPTFNATSTSGGGFQGIAGDSAGAPSFTWTGDTNTGVYTPGADLLAMTTGGVERLRVSSAGIDAKSGKILNVATPTGSNDAANKSYVDAQVSGVAGVDNTVVRTFGAQSIAGAKSFTSGVQVNVPAAAANTSANHLELRASSGTATDEVSVLFHNPGSYWAQIRARQSGFHFTDGGNGNYRDVFARNLMSDGGTAALPAFSFSADSNTGFFRNAENEVGFAAAGAERFRMTTSGIDMLNRKVTGLATPTATTDAANKAYVDAQVSGAVDSTVVRTFGTQTIDGSKRFTSTIEADNGNIVVDGDSNRLVWFRNSAGLAKGLVYSDETNKQMKMRLYDPAGSGSVVAQIALIQDGRTISQGKVEAPTFNATSTSEGGFQGIATDSAGAPSFTWTGDTNTGVYKPGTDIVGLTTGGVERLRVSSSGTDVKGLKVLNVATPTSGTDAANKSYVDSAVSGVAAVDNTVVRTFGDQTVSGTKTFNSSIVTKGASLYVDGGSSRHIWFRDTAGKNLGILFQNNSTGAMHLRAYDNGAGTGTRSELQLLQDGRATFSGKVEAPTFNATSTSGGGFQGIDTDSAGSPSFTWSTDSNTGFFRAAENAIGFTGGGAERFRMTTSGIDMLNRKVYGLATPTSGTDAANKSYVDAQVGSIQGVDNTVVRTTGNQTVGGTKTFTSTVVGPTFNATSTTGGGFQGIGGDTAGAPSFTWTGDTDTGIYRTNANEMGFSTGGGQRLLIKNGEVDFSVTPLFDTGNAILRSNGNRALYFRNNSNAEQALIYHEEASNQLRFYLRNTGNTSWVTSLVIDDGGAISPGGNGYFSGNGSGLTNLDANDLSSGTVPDARLPLRHAASSATGAVAYNGQTRANGEFYGGNTDPSSTGRRLNFDGYFSATRMYSNMYLYFSDERLKEEIEVMAQPMEKIRDLRPVTYRWKQNGEKAMGLIAQEVEVVYPEIVRESGSGFKAVDYTQLISPMLAAIQELDARLTALETKE